MCVAGSASIHDLPLADSGAVNGAASHCQARCACTLEVAEPNVVVRSSDRCVASRRSYHIELEAEQPLALLAVGCGRHFGIGRLVAMEAD